MIKKIAKALMYLIVFIVVILAGLIIFGTVTDYKPEAEEMITHSAEGSGESVISDSVLTFCSWNIGYCGLGKEMDFFYDGGEMVRPDKKQHTKYLAGVKEQIKEMDDVDFFLFQEVDMKSKRSYKSDQNEEIGVLLPNHTRAFAPNYDVRLIPFPFTEPMGKVFAGQMTASLYLPVESKRIAFPSSYSWPKRIFFLDRCFIMSRFETSFGNELVIINTHNSAFDQGGFLREQEMDVILKFMQDEYEKGNYVVAGGDWNLNPPGFENHVLPEPFKTKYVDPPLNADAFPAGWTVAFDGNVPTNRDNKKLYIEGETEVTVIDFFVLSPNIQLLEIKGKHNGFSFSDHQAVNMKVMLIPEGRVQP